MVKKITRKELKEPDQFQEFSARVLQYVDTHIKKLYIAAGIVVAAIILAVGLYFYSSHCEENALAMYAQAYGTYQTIDDNKKNESYVKAISLYEELIGKYPRTGAAMVALFNLGNLYFNLGDIDKSIDSYTLFLEKASEDNILAPLAYYGLGYCYETKKNYNDALQSFENSGTISGKEFYQAMNYENMARVYEEMGSPQKAEEYYRKVLEKTNDPMREKLVRRKISMLDIH